MKNFYKGCMQYWYLRSYKTPLTKILSDGKSWTAEHRWAGSNPGALLGFSIVIQQHRRGSCKKQLTTCSCNCFNTTSQDLLPLRFRCLGVLFYFHWEPNWIKKWSFQLSCLLWLLDYPLSAWLTWRLIYRRKEIWAQKGP